MCMRLLKPMGHAALFALTTFGFATQGFAAPARTPAVPPVTITQVKQQDVPQVVQTVGTVLASATVQVKSLVEGRVLEAFFTEGQLVDKGDILFRVDPAPFNADLAKAQAILARDKAQLTKAQQELTRQENLRKRGVSSAQTLETARAEALAAVATVASDQAAVELAKLKLGYTEIRAPISGKTGEILVHPGNIVKANADAPMVTISAITPVRVAVTLPQKHLPKIQKLMADGGTDLMVKVPADPTRPANGRVDFVAATVNQQSGTIEVRATIKNRDMRLVPGQFVTGTLTLNTFHNAMTVPETAIAQSQDGPYVYRVDTKNMIALHPIHVQYVYNGTAVITSPDIKAGDTLIAAGHLRLKDGMQVRITKTAAGNGAVTP